MRVVPVGAQPPGALMSEALALSERTLHLLVEGTGAIERTVKGGPVLVAGDQESATGTMRVFDGASDSDLDTIVWTKLEVPARGVTTCMIFAFTRAESALPHFTLDCSDHGDGGHAFHLDLAPRVELATHVAYMDEAFEPLSPLYEAAAGIEGLSATRTTRRQYAMMSPWMLVHLADASAFAAIQPTVEAYAQHWLRLLDTGLSEQTRGSVADSDLAQRNRVFRRNLFSPEIDPVWGRVDAMIGPEAAAVMRATLSEG
jgi:hypothetical protein